ELHDVLRHGTERRTFRHLAEHVDEPRELFVQLDEHRGLARAGLACDVGGAPVRKRADVEIERCIEPGAGKMVGKKADEIERAVADGLKLDELLAGRSRKRVVKRENERAFK